MPPTRSTAAAAAAAAAAATSAPNGTTATSRYPRRGQAGTGTSGLSIRTPVTKLSPKKRESQDQSTTTTSMHSMKRPRRTAAGTSDHDEPSSQPNKLEEDDADADAMEQSDSDQPSRSDASTDNEDDDEEEDDDNNNPDNGDKTRNGGRTSTNATSPTSSTPGEKKPRRKFMKSATGGAPWGERRGRLPMFDGDPVEFPPDRILTVDSNGVPLAALPIIDYEKEKGITREALLKTATAGQYNTAARWWLKGQRLHRPAVQKGAAVILEWWDAMHENRPRRNVYVDHAKAAPLVPRAPPKPPRASPSFLNPRKRASSMVPPPISMDGITRGSTRRASAAAAAAAVAASSTDLAPQVFGLPVSGQPSSSGGALIDSLNPSNVLLPHARDGPTMSGDLLVRRAVDKWEVALPVVTGAHLLELGTFDARDEAIGMGRVASKAVDELIIIRKLKRGHVVNETCQACGKGHDLLPCSCCTSVFHVGCLEASGYLDQVKASTPEKWVCPTCVYEFSKMAILAIGGDVEVMVAKPQYRAQSQAHRRTITTSTIRTVATAADTAVLTGMPGSENPLVAPRTLSDPVEEQLRYVATRDSETEWLGYPYVSPPGRTDYRAYYSAFRFRASDEEYHLFDHVLITRRAPEDEEESDPTQREFFAGQIEALWEERSTGDRKMRISWMFWPEETLPGGAPEDGKPVDKTSRELITSLENDVEDIYRVVAKIQVLSEDKWVAKQQQQQTEDKEGHQETKDNGQTVIEQPHEVKETVQELITDMMEDVEDATKNEVVNGSTLTVSDDMEDHGDEYRNEQDEEEEKHQGSEDEEEDHQMETITATTTTTTTTTTKGSRRQQALIDIALFRECARCGMWGFRTPAESGAHTARYCGEDTPEMLQQRRMQAGRPIETGERVPRPATIQVESVRSLRAKEPLHGSTSAFISMDRSVGAATRSVSTSVIERARGEAALGPYFSRRHFHQRTQQVVECDSNGMNPWQSSFLFATQEEPQVQPSSLSNDGDGDAHAFVPLCSLLPNRSVALSHHKCGYCRKSLTRVDPVISCSVCPHLVLCLSCVHVGRQGLGWIGTDNVKGTSYHRVTHSYGVNHSGLDPVNPGTDATDALDVATKSLPGARGAATYELLEIVRNGPSTSDGVPPRPKFRYGVRLDFPSRPPGIVGSEWSDNVETAKSHAALAALTTFFGTSHSLNAPLLSRDWSIWEAGCLLDALQNHGLAWEPASLRVGTKTATQCRQFYFDTLLVAWETRLAELQAVKEEKSASSPSPEDLEQDAVLTRLSTASLKLVMDDAVTWAKRVRAWRLRRITQAQRSARGSGLMCAMVGENVIRLPAPTRRMKPGKPCTICGKSQRAIMSTSPSPTPGSGVVVDESNPEVVMCVSCGDEFHVTCMSSEDRARSITEAEENGGNGFVCSDCLDDESYVYQHTCWGTVGRLLCEMSEKYGNDSELVGVSLDWKENARLVHAASLEASTAVDTSGFEEAPLERSKPNDALSESREMLMNAVNMRKEEQLRLRRSAAGRLAAARKKVGEEGGDPYSVERSDDSVVMRNVDATVFASGERRVLLEPNEDTYEPSPIPSWVLKHYAEPLVAALQTSNRGMAQALMTVTEERNALAKLLKEMTAKNVTPSMNHTVVVGTTTTSVPETSKSDDGR